MTTEHGRVVYNVDALSPLTPTVYKRSMTIQRVTVRPACGEDLDALVQGNVKLAEETEHLRLDVDTLRLGIRALLESQVPGRYLVAEIDGRVVGQVLVTFEWSDWRNCTVWWIQSVYVAPNARGGGVFRTLYDAVRREAVASGAGGLRLYVDTTNIHAQAVYGALGMDGGHYRVFEDMFEEPLRSGEPQER
jgi:GNAT superfamily N-acetyltransferase